ncbi:MAG TPA: aspartate aminotransferase family protein [Atribacteraceae bacterium]|nr:aspartate aminotransferase family protein [Atribacteraceae bacterium]
MLHDQTVALEKNYILDTYTRLPVVLERGKGCRVFDADGKEYLDCVAGLAVNLLGYGFLPLGEAICAEAQRLIHASNLYYTLPQVELARILTGLSGFPRVFFNNSGAEANEVALKMARFYGRRKHSNRHKYIAFHRSFHGRTLLTLSVTGQAKFHQDLDPLPPGIVFAELNDFSSVAGAYDESVCGVIIEPVQGEGGVYPCDPGFLQDLRDFCTEKDLILIFDEIQCGMGRTGSFFAFQEFGITPDIVTLAKGLGGGLPIGAVLAGAKVVSITRKGDQGSTFGGNPVCCRAAAVVSGEIGQDRFLAGVRLKGEFLGKRLGELRDAFPGLVREVRGMGLIWGIDVPGRAKEVVQGMLAEQVLVNACNENTVRLLPPLVIGEEELGTACAALRRVLERIGEPETRDRRELIDYNEKPA